MHIQELQTETEKIVRKMMKFLQIDPDDTRLRCILENDIKKYKRVNKQQNHDPYSKAQHQLIDDLIDKADEFLQKRIGLKLPKQLYDFYQNYEDSCRTFSRGMTKVQC